MTYYDWDEILKQKSNQELKQMLFDEGTGNDIKEKVKQELERRREQDKIEQENIEHGIYPPIPKVKKSDNKIGRGIISYLSFVLVFTLIFDWDLKLLIIITLVLLLHEMGHLLAMKVFGYKDLSLFFLPFFGAAATGEKEQISKKQKATLLLAGPVPGIVLGMILFFTQTNEIMLEASLVLLSLNMLNLLPVYPLDGGQLLSNFIGNHKENFEKVFFLASAAVVVFFAMRWQDYFLLILPLILFLRVSAVNKNQMQRRKLQEAGFDTNKSFSELTRKEYWTIRDQLAKINPVFAKLIKSDKYERSEKENMIINLMKSLFYKAELNDLSMAHKILIIAVWLGSIAIPLIIVLPKLNIF